MAGTPGAVAILRWVGWNGLRWQTHTRRLFVCLLDLDLSNLSDFRLDVQGRQTRGCPSSDPEHRYTLGSRAFLIAN